MSTKIINWIEDCAKHHPESDYNSDRYVINNIISEANQLNMVDVLSRYGVKFARMTGNRAIAMCPMHAANKLGSFSVNISKNLCWCFACQQGGSNVKTYQKMFDVDEKTAALRIAYDFDLITKSEFEKYSDEQYTKAESNSNNRFKYTTPKPVYTEETLKIRTDAYEFMRDYFGLTKEHRDYLSSIRNLAADRIDQDYFSINTKTNPAIGESFCKEFATRFPQYASKMNEIPGFFEHKNRRTDKWIPTLMMFDGIGILIRDANKNVLGVQIRMTNPDMNGIRYKFMSCDFGDGSKKMSRGGATCGTPIDVLFPEKISPDTMVCLAEGRFKTEVLRQQGCIGISIQGVNNFNGIDQVLNAIEQKLGRDIKTLYTFYDADLVENPQVFKALISLHDYLNQEKPELKMAQMVWQEEKGKGIDDCILNGYRSCIKPVSMEEMIEIYEIALKEATLISGLHGVKPVKMTREDRDRFCNSFKTITCSNLF